jgi:hypothetical protein
MFQCDVYSPCAAPEPPTVVETTRVIQPPPRVVIVQPRVFVQPRRTVVIKKPPIYECGSSWAGCPRVGGWVPRPYGPPAAPAYQSSYQSSYHSHGEAFMSQGGYVDGGEYEQ